jgi:hypothetical protein
MKMTKNKLKILREDVAGPKPRKTYEYKNISQALKCSVEAIYGKE